MSDDHVKRWAKELGLAVRRCYLSDTRLHERTKALGISPLAIIAARLPDASATMAGDFGEILAYFYQAAKEHPATAIGPKKWRLKQDRAKPAPRSDVVHFVLPTWPTPSDDDVVLCSEVKTKSTKSKFSPIKSAIEDSAKDRTSRLAKTLVWLRERAMTEDLGDVQLPGCSSRYRRLPRSRAKPATGPHPPFQTISPMASRGQPCPAPSLPGLAGYTDHPPTCLSNALTDPVQPLRHANGPRGSSGPRNGRPQRRTRQGCE